MSFSASLVAACATAVAAAMPSVPLGPGVDIPVVGSGSCCGKYDIPAWLAQGNLHIDTSVDYGSQPDIAAAIKASGIPRDKLWLTSKINPESYGTNVSDAVEQLVLAPLETPYVDLILMHHAGRHQTDTNPHPDCFDANDPEGTYAKCRLDTFKSFLDLKARGKVRAVGVSNWEQRELEQVFNATGVWPSVNQIEHHPYWHTDQLVQFCRSKGIKVEAYAPMGNYPSRSKLLDDPALKAVASATGKTVGQVALKWEMQAGADIVIPRSQEPNHMKENVDVFDFSLTPAQAASLASLPQNKIYNTQCQPWC